jgi:hypothetical protein
MDVKENVIEILTDIYNKSNSDIIKKMIKDITNDCLFNNKFIYLRKLVLLNFSKHHPKLEISSENIKYVINYLESIEIMQELSK